MTKTEPAERVSTCSLWQGVAPRHAPAVPALRVALVPRSAPLPAAALVDVRGVSAPRNVYKKPLPPAGLPRNKLSARLGRSGLKLALKLLFPVRCGPQACENAARSAALDVPRPDAFSMACKARVVTRRAEAKRRNVRAWSLDQARTFDGISGLSWHSDRFGREKNCMGR